MLNGNALQQFLLERFGQTFDDVVETNATLKELASKPIAAYRQWGIARQWLALEKLGK